MIRGGRALVMRAEATPADTTNRQTDSLRASEASTQPQHGSQSAPFGPGWRQRRGGGGRRDQGGTVTVGIWAQRRPPQKLVGTEVEAGLAHLNSPRGAPQPQPMPPKRVDVVESAVALIHERRPALALVPLLLRLVQPVVLAQRLDAAAHRGRGSHWEVCVGTVERRVPGLGVRVRPPRSEPTLSRPMMGRTPPTQLWLRRRGAADGAAGAVGGGRTPPLLLLLRRRLSQPT